MIEALEPLQGQEYFAKSSLNHLAYMNVYSEVLPKANATEAASE